MAARSDSRLALLGLSGCLVDDRGLRTGVGSLPAGEINADLAPLLLLVRRVRYVNLEFARSPLFGNATGSAQEILQAEEQLRILEKDVHAATRSPEWPQRGRFSQFQQRVCNVKLLPGRTSLKTKALGQRQLVGSRRAAERRRRPRGGAASGSGGRCRAPSASWRFTLFEACSIAQVVRPLACFAPSIAPVCSPV